MCAVTGDNPTCFRLAAVVGPIAITCRVNTFTVTHDKNVHSTLSAHLQQGVQRTIPTAKGKKNIIAILLKEPHSTNCAVKHNTSIRANME